MEVEEVHEVSSKKRIADRIVKVYPQEQLTRATAFFDDSRFLFVSNYGYIVETR